MTDSVSPDIRALSAMTTKAKRYVIRPFGQYYQAPPGDETLYTLTEAFEHIVPTCIA